MPDSTQWEAPDPKTRYKFRLIDGARDGEYLGARGERVTYNRSTGEYERLSDDRTVIARSRVLDFLMNPTTGRSRARKGNPVLAARQSREEGERRTMAAVQRTGGNPTVHTDACHTRVAQQWNGDYRNLHRSPTPGCQGCAAGRGKRR